MSAISRPDSWDQERLRINYVLLNGFDPARLFVTSYTAQQIHLQYYIINTYGLTVKEQLILCFCVLRTIDRTLRCLKQNLHHNDFGHKLKWFSGRDISGSIQYFHVHIIPEKPATLQ